MKTVVALLLAVAGICMNSGVARAEGKGVHLTPDNLDKHPIRFRIQVGDWGESKSVMVIVEDREKRSVPVITAWLNVSEGKDQILSCRLATEKLASYDFGTGVSFHIAPKRLDNAKVTIERIVKGADSAAGVYWFYMKDFVKVKE